MPFIRFFLALFSLMLVFSCDKSLDIPPGGFGGPNLLEWNVPKDQVFDSGAGVDGIPSVDHPNFDLAEDVQPFFDDELVLGFEHEGELKAYPVPILDWHEIVNDELNGRYIAITYCPLTGTGIGWNRKIRRDITTFGVSGLLYNTNLMPYDRETESTWSQQRLECVNGLYNGWQPETYSLIETTFRTWKKSFPNSKVMNANTGFVRRYSAYPYGDYRTNDDLLFFPVSNKDQRLPAKERVLGVMVNDQAKAYRFNAEENGTEVIHDQVDGTTIIVVISKKDNYNTVFLNPDDLEFEAIQDGLPSIMKDGNGNLYDLAGRVILGPDQGQKLGRPTAFIGYWFSWGAFYPNIEIYDN